MCTVVVSTDQKKRKYCKDFFPRKSVSLRRTRVQYTTLVILTLRSKQRFSASRFGLRRRLETNPPHIPHTYPAHTRCYERKEIIAASRTNFAHLSSRLPPAVVPTDLKKHTQNNPLRYSHSLSLVRILTPKLSFLLIHSFSPFSIFTFFSFFSASPSVFLSRIRFFFCNIRHKSVAKNETERIYVRSAGGRRAKGVEECTRRGGDRFLRGRCRLYVVELFALLGAQRHVLVVVG